MKIANSFSAIYTGRHLSIDDKLTTAASVQSIAFVILEEILPKLVIDRLQ